MARGAVSPWSAYYFWGVVDRSQQGASGSARIAFWPERQCQFPYSAPYCVSRCRGFLFGSVGTFSSNSALRKWIGRPQSAPSSKALSQKQVQGSLGPHRGSRLIRRPDPLRQQAAMNCC